ncbi:MAG: T9SS type A sorting domain-containing protein [Bacteroidetes bacterium]|nr:T9SS type A sorting domain-containing protein [Bacteroidota bacterium]
MKKNYIFFFLLGITISSYAKIYKVGSTRTYTLPSQVAGLVNDGDTVDIDTGTYSDCATWNKNNLLLRGIGGMAHIKDVVCSGKGIWNFNGSNITVEYIEFSGAANPSLNGAGIRGQGGAFTVRYSYFHDNENGILCNDPVAGTSDVLVEYSEFGNNGNGDGYSHNMYIGNMKNFTLRYSYTHHSKIGHEIKSRSNNNYILYNRISDESSGTSSRNIDLPNGGLAVIIGNLIEQGPNSGNSNIVGYGLEGLINTAPHDIYLVNNTIVNNKSAGSFVNIYTGTGILKMVNNIFAGTGTVIVGTPTTLDSTANFITTTVSSIGFVNATNYDYQLLSTAKVIGKGSNPGLAGIYSLTPVVEYVHKSGKRNRPVNGIIDIGAYEFPIVTGIAQPLEDESASTLAIFPNPVSSKFILSINNFNSGTLKIINTLGQILFLEKIEQGNEQMEISMENFPAGFYSAVYETKEKIIYKKIIKE